MVVPTGNKSPGLWLDVRVWVPELSVAVGAVHVTVAVATPDPVLTDWFPGQPLITGSSASKGNTEIQVKIQTLLL